MFVLAYYLRISYAVSFVFMSRTYRQCGEPVWLCLAEEYAIAWHKSKEVVTSTIWTVRSVSVSTSVSLS